MARCAITFCIIGLIAGSLCAESVDGRMLNQQASVRRRLMPIPLRGSYNPDAPDAPAERQNSPPFYPLPLPAPTEAYFAAPAAPMGNLPRPAPPAATHNQDFYKTVNCGAYGACPRRIGRRIFALDLEKLENGHN